MPTENPIHTLVDTYRARGFSDREWGLVGPVIRAAVHAMQPGTPGTASSLQVTLAAFLKLHTVWDRTQTPDLDRLLTTANIDAATSDAAFGSPLTRGVRGDKLRHIATTLGILERTAPSKPQIDLTPREPTVSFRTLAAPTPDPAVAAQATSNAISAYTPKPETLPPEAWGLVAAEARTAAAAAQPKTPAAARVLLSSLVAYLADPLVWDRNARPAFEYLLQAGNVVEHVARTRFNTDETRANRQKYLLRIGRAIGAVPTAPERKEGKKNKTVDPFMAVGVSLPIPTFVLAAARGTSKRDGAVNLDGIASSIARQMDATPTTDTAVWSEATLQMLAGLTTSTNPSTPVSTMGKKTQGKPKPRTGRGALAEAKRAYKQLQAAAAEQADGGLAELPDPSSVPPEIREAVEAYLPKTERRKAWAVNRELATRLVYAYQAEGPRNNVASCVAHYVHWASTHGGRDAAVPLALSELLHDQHIEQFIAESTWQGPSISTARSILHRLERNLRPNSVPIKIAHGKPGAPYTPEECLTFVRLAWNQPTELKERRLAFIVGLGLGAGVTAVDLRYITAAHFETIEINGASILLVHIPGEGVRARTVPVRDEYVPLVQLALQRHANAGKGPHDLVVAHCPTAVNVAADTLRKIASADSDDCSILTARLRHTWLVAGMSAPVPMADLMRAAGIRSARTLTELLEYCPAPDPAHVQAVYAELSAIVNLDNGGQR